MPPTELPGWPALRSWRRQSRRSKTSGRELCQCAVVVRANDDGAGRKTIARRHLRHGRRAGGLRGPPSPGLARAPRRARPRSSRARVLAADDRPPQCRSRAPAARPRHVAGRSAPPGRAQAGPLSATRARGPAARRVPRAVATSASRYDADRLLGETGLRERFDAVVTAEDVRRGKPDPEVYLLAARRLGIAPARCLVFEDAVVGVQAARSAGMRIIGVSTAHTETEPLAARAQRAGGHLQGGSWPAG